ncbi:hypothetical protein A6770_09820 [Nostoc minutum NIES-26]|uniref:Uncharacterized protein n=1 Tax=Nostoc minutum NIES-26 TaxID=1844469 RepID=A0A367RY99_9NOSO|nr:hypothetical protein A6770_09820 [Nostoc minutum NIES-26]
MQIKKNPEVRTQNSEQEHGDVIPVLQKTARDDDAGTWGRGEKADNFSLLPPAFYLLPSAEFFVDKHNLINKCEQDSNFTSF